MPLKSVKVFINKKKIDSTVVPIFDSQFHSLAYLRLRLLQPLEPELTTVGAGEAPEAFLGPLVCPTGEA